MNHSMEAAVTLSQKVGRWCSEEKGRRLYDLVLERSEDSPLTVELGVFSGSSLFCFAFAHAVIHSGHVIGIDPWTVDAALEGSNDPANAQWWQSINFETILSKLKENISEYKLEHVIYLWREKSTDAVNRFEDNSISILHADSNHSPEVSTREVELYAPKLISGGLWIADDYNWTSLIQAREKLDELGFVELEDHTTFGILRKP